MIDVGKIIDYESGNMDMGEIIEFFQQMIDDGSVWQLQGHYGRTAMALIESGNCHKKGER
jgi:hypothetical protein